MVFATHDMQNVALFLGFFGQDAELRIRNFAGNMGYLNKFRHVALWMHV